MLIHCAFFRAVRLRKVLGGGWRQPGPLAAAALIALSTYKQHLAQDHKHAKMFAQGVYVCYLYDKGTNKEQNL